MRSWFRKPKAPSQADVPRQAGAGLDLAPRPAPTGWRATSVQEAWSAEFAGTGLDGWVRAHGESLFRAGFTPRMGKQFHTAMNSINDAYPPLTQLMVVSVGLANLDPVLIPVWAKAPASVGTLDVLTARTPERMQRKAVSSWITAIRVYMRTAPPEDAELIACAALANFSPDEIHLLIENGQLGMEMLSPMLHLQGVNQLIIRRN